MRSLPFVLTCLAAAGVAQSGGAVLALPHGFSVGPATALGGLLPGELAFSDTGIDGVLPTPPGPPLVPDFATYLGGAAVDVDAVTLGLDWILANAAGEAVVAPNQWGAITFTVSRATVGAPGSVVAAEAAGASGAAADVFAYVIPPSALPPALVGEPFRAQDAAELAAPLAGGGGNLDAHDLYVSMIYVENPQLAALLPPPTVYFSVTDASVPAIPAAWTAVAAERSGATVFATTWDPMTSTWSPVAVAYTAPDFGIDPSEDLDALALDLVRGFALFSVDPALPPPAGPARDPILFTLLGSATNVVYRLPVGPPISVEVGLGLGPDDIDGICSLDPGGVLPGPFGVDRLLATPEPPLLPTAPVDLAASAWRRFDPVSQQEFAVTWMTGWPPPGNPQPSLAVSAGALSPFGPYVVLDVFVRPQPTNPFQGHPEHTELVIPPSISLSGQPLFLLWGALSPNTFTTSLPLRLTL